MASSGEYSFKAYDARKGNGGSLADAHKSHSLPILPYINGFFSVTLLNYTDGGIGDQDEEDDKRLDEGGSPASTGLVRIFEASKNKGDDSGTQENQDQLILELRQNQGEHGGRGLFREDCHCAQRNISETLLFNHMLQLTIPPIQLLVLPSSRFRQPVLFCNAVMCERILNSVRPRVGQHSEHKSSLSGPSILSKMLLNFGGKRVEQKFLGHDRARGRCIFLANFVSKGE